MQNNEINISITAQDKTREALQKAQGSLESFKGKVESMKPAFEKMAAVGTVAFGAITAVGVSSLRAFAEAQQETAQTNLILQNALDEMSGGVLQKFQKEIGGTTNMLGSVQVAMTKASDAAVKLGFDDEEAAKSFARLFSASKSTEQSMKDIALAQDLARFSGRSLEESTQAILAIYAGSGTRVLKEFGIQLKDNATKQDIFNAVMAKSKGSAEGFAKSMQGSMEVLKVQLGNLQENIGEALAPAVAKLLEKVKPIVEKFVEWASNNPELLSKIVLIAGAIAGLVAGMGALGLILPAIITAFTVLSGPVGIIAAVIGVLVAGFFMLRDRLSGIWEFLKDIGVLDYFKQIWESISTTFNTVLLPAFQQLWSVMGNLRPLLEIVAKIVGGVLLGAFMILAKALEIAFSLLANIFSMAVKIADFFVGSFKKAIQALGDAFDWVAQKIQSVINFFEELWNKATRFGGSAVKAVSSAITKVFNVNDAVVTPGGNVIKTSPQDYIFATKDPASLAGGGGLVVNIYNSNLLSNEAGDMLGDQILQKLRGSFKL